MKMPLARTASRDNQSMNWIDLHCDTPLRLYRKRQALRQNTLHIDLEKAKGFSQFLQCAALFCPAEMTDEDGFAYILEMADYFLSEIRKNSDCARLIQTADDLKTAKAEASRAFILTVEDGRILNGKLSRLDVLWALGVRILTPLWRGTSILGGAHDTDLGLSDFGKMAVEKMLSIGMLPDVSHASIPSFWDIAEQAHRAGKPLLATHSCAYALCPHTRNLTDAQIRAISESGGVIGVNLYPPFLTAGKATVDDVLRCIRYFLKVGGMDCVSFGTDLDGVDALPVGIRSLADMSELPERMYSSGFSADEVEHVFYRNAERILDLVL